MVGQSGLEGEIFNPVHCYSAITYFSVRHFLLGALGALAANEFCRRFHDQFSRVPEAGQHRRHHAEQSAGQCTVGEQGRGEGHPGCTQGRRPRSSRARLRDHRRGTQLQRRRRHQRIRQALRPGQGNASRCPGLHGYRDQADRRRDIRSHHGRRPGTGAGLPLSNRADRRPDCAARSKARHPPRCRRNPAGAAADGCGEGAGFHGCRRSDLKREGEGSWSRGRGRYRRFARGRNFLREQTAQG